MHNNYLTLPVVFAMLSNHFPFDIRAQLVVADPDRADDASAPGSGISSTCATPGGRRGGSRSLRRSASQWSPSRSDRTTGPSSSGTEATAVSIARARAIVQARCVPCHSAHPTRMDSAPLGIVFDTPEQMHAQASLIEQVAVSSKTMPLGNATGMTQAERDELGAWIRQGAKIK